MQVRKFFKSFACAASLSLIGSCVFAQNSTPFLGFNERGQVVTNDMPFLVTALQPSMSNERVLQVGSGLSTADGGANGPFTISLGPVLSYFNGTGATTQQAAINAICAFPGLASGDIFYWDGTNVSRLPKGANNTVVGVNGSGVFGYYSPSGSGTVTSVGLVLPSWLAQSGGPITGSGNITISNGTGLSNYYAVCTDGTGALSLQALSANHIPNLSAAKITSGNLTKSVSATVGVYNDQSNTYTGTFTQDISNASQTLLIPLRAAPATNGAISINSADLEFRASGATHKAAKQAITITAGTGLSGGGDLSANRTLSLPTVPYTLGGTGQTTAPNGTILVGNGTGYTQIGPGSAGQVPISNGTTITMGSVGGGFGGDGRDGATTKGAVTETTIVQIAATTITQTPSTTYVPKSGSVYRSTSTQDWNGTTNVSTAFTTLGGTAGATTPGPNGSGPCPGIGSTGGGGFSASGGAGGGGNAGAGARGGDGATSGAVGGQTQELYTIGGSSGGTAGATGSAGGTGGNGGGVFYAESIGNFTIGSGGSINATGATGGTGGAVSSAAGGGGGGGGGTIQILCQGTFTKTGNVTANGGNGGEAGGAGGGKGGAGGGGRIVVMAPTITGAGSLTANGGSNATTGSTTNLGTPGAGVATSITGTPTTRFAADMRKNYLAVDTMYGRAVVEGRVKAGQEYKTEAREIFALQAALTARSENERAHIAHEYNFGTTFDGTCQAEWIETNCDNDQEQLKNVS